MDIRDILTAVELKEDPELSAMFDYRYIDRWVERIGAEAATLWEELKRNTRTN